VETQEEFDAWMASKQPQYKTVQQANAPAPAAADTATAKVSQPLAQLK